MNAAAVRQSSARLALGGGPIDLHYRVAGSGPPLFLLHPSPFSSAFMVPLMRRLACRATLIAPDTPGFGDSEPVADAGKAQGLAPWVEAMIALRASLGLDRIAVYGSATGAQIAVEWAKADGGAVRGVVLDNAASFSDAERGRIMDGYFPDLRPAADGSHLARAWQAAHDATLFFPWQRPAADGRVAPRLGAAASMDLAARAYLAAGPGYEAAYRAAFLNERAERVRPIEAPLVVLRWQGSILKRWTDRFDELEWGGNVVMAHCGPTPEDRWSCLESLLDRVLPDQGAAARDLCLDSGSIRYADAGFGPIRYRVNGEGGAAGVVLHGLGGAGDLADAPPGGSGWARIDLPGHGGSAHPEGLGVDHCVRAVRRIVETLDAERVTVTGTGATARLARMAARGDPRIRFEEMAVPWFGGVLPDLTPEASGAHLWRAWYWLRGQYLERNESPPEPARLTRMLLALLDAQAAYRTLQGALDAPGADGGYTS